MAQKQNVIKVRAAPPAPAQVPAQLPVPSGISHCVGVDVSAGQVPGRYSSRTGVSLETGAGAKMSINGVSYDTQEEFESALDAAIATKHIGVVVTAKPAPIAPREVKQFTFHCTRLDRVLVVNSAHLWFRELPPPGPVLNLGALSQSKLCITETFKCTAIEMVAQNQSDVQLGQGSCETLGFHVSDDGLGCGIRAAQFLVRRNLRIVHADDASSIKLLRSSECAVDGSVENVNIQVANPA